MRNARKQAQDAKHVPPPNPTELPAAGVSPSEARQAEEEWYAEAWDDISGIYVDQKWREEWRAYLKWRQRELDALAPDDNQPSPGPRP